MGYLSPFGALGQRNLLRRGLSALLSHVPGWIAKRFTTDSWLAKVTRPLLDPLVPSEPTEIVIRSGQGKGLKLFVDLRHEKYYLTGTWELPVQEALTSELRPSASFWDVGAHVGLFTVIAASRGAFVHAFEPLPDNRSRLEKAISANNLENVMVHPYAIGATSRETILRASESTSQWTLVGEGKGIPVAERTLDEMVELLGPPSIVKIDVEGAEVEVLEGAQRLLTEVGPVLLIEFTSSRHVARASEVVPSHSFHRLSEKQWLLRPGSR